MHLEGSMRLLKAYNEFTSGNFEFGANVQAVAITAGVQAQAGTTGATMSVQISAQRPAPRPKMIMSTAQPPSCTLQYIQALIKQGQDFFPKTNGSVQMTDVFRLALQLRSNAIFKI